MRNMNRIGNNRFYLVISVDITLMSIAAGSLILAFLAPIFYSFGYEHAAEIIRIILKPLCHQIPSRCFHLLGHPMSLCVRCSAIFFGILIARLLLQINQDGFVQVISPAFNWLNHFPVKFLFLFQMVIEWTLHSNGLLKESMLLRFISGFLFGVGWTFSLHLYLIRQLRRFSERWLFFRLNSFF